MAEQILDSVKSKYAAVAESSLSSDHAGVKAVAEAFGYTAEELTSIPAEANMGLSCGNPTATAHLRPGEVVVDLGSGGGLDVFLSSKQVGPHRPRHRHRYDARHDRACPRQCQIRRLHQRRFPSLHHRQDSAPRCVGRLRHLQLRSESRTRQARRLPRNCPRSQARRPPRRQRHRLEARTARGDREERCRLCRLHRRSHPHRRLSRGLLAAGFEHVEIVDSGADLNAYAKS